MTIKTTHNSNKSKSNKYNINNKLLLRSFIAAVVIVFLNIFTINFDQDFLNNDGPHQAMQTFLQQNKQQQRQQDQSKPQSQQESVTTLDKQRQLKPNNNNDNNQNGNKNGDVQASSLSAAAKAATDNVNYHVVFSTGCSVFQDWQSYVFFYHVLQSGQQGQVTRIVSGCDEKDTISLKGLFEEQIKPMAPDRFSLHFTPDYSKVKPGLKFKYFNKPFGMRDWMQNSLGYPDTHSIHDDTIVILLDPDQILLRPFTNDFSNSTEAWKNRSSKTPYATKVTHGSPFAQQYGFGLQWKDKVQMSHITTQQSRVDTMPREEARDFYWAMGPPYVATAKDMYNIVTTWCDFVPRIHDDYPHLLAEMFGYNLAAAHLNIPHTIAHSFMVSDIAAGGEAWKYLIEPVGPNNVCSNFPQSQLPHVLHYCQRYMLGKWFIGKYRLRKDFISCESPLLREPPNDIAIQYTFAVAPGDGKIKRYAQEKHRVGQAFMLCTLIRALNDAATYFKQQHCQHVENVNYEKSYIFFDDIDTNDY